MNTDALSIERSIEQKISAALQPQHLHLVNESRMHAGPATDSHFKLTVVSDEFRGLSKVARHRLAYRVLSAELAGPVHALALHLFTPEEWETQQQVPASPQCAGKNI